MFSLYSHYCNCLMKEVGGKIGKWANCLYFQPLTDNQHNNINCSKNMTRFRIKIFNLISNTLKSSVKLKWFDRIATIPQKPMFFLFFLQYLLIYDSILTKVLLESSHMTQRTMKSFKIYLPSSLPNNHQRLIYITIIWPIWIWTELQTETIEFPSFTTNVLI